MKPLEILRFTYGPFAENTYVVVGPSGRAAMLVDPGLESEPIGDALAARGLSIALIVNTHGHLDHVAGNAHFKGSSGAPLAAHPGDAPLLASVRAQGALYGFELTDSPPADIALVDGGTVSFDGVSFEVIHTPGHSPGGVCLRRGAQMLVGDTLFRGSVGRTDLPGGDGRQLLASIRERLFVLPDEVVCFPGHEEITTIGEERRSNPFVSDAALRMAR